MLGVLCSRWRTRRFMALRCSNIFISQFLCLMNSLQKGPLKKIVSSHYVSHLESVIFVVHHQILQKNILWIVKVWSFSTPKKKTWGGHEKLQRKIPKRFGHPRNACWRLLVLPWSLVSRSHRWPRGETSGGWKNRGGTYLGRSFTFGETSR